MAVGDITVTLRPIRFAFLVNLADRELSVLDSFRAGKRLAGEAEPMANLETFRRRFL